MPIYITSNKFAAHSVNKKPQVCTTDPILGTETCVDSTESITTDYYSRVEVVFSGVTNPGSVKTTVYADDTNLWGSGNHGSLNKEFYSKGLTRSTDGHTITVKSACWQIAAGAAPSITITLIESNQENGGISA